MGLAVYKTTKAATLSNVVKRMDDREYSIESYVLLAGDGEARDIVIGQPLGKITAGGVVSAARAADAGNTGNGVMTLANPAFAAGAKLGVYNVICIEPSTNGGTFEVIDPDGVAIGHAVVGAAFTGNVKFTIADGATDFAAGDLIAITLSQAAGADDGKVMEWDPAATDGSQKIWAFAANDITAADGVDNETAGIAIRRQAILRDGGITWPAGLTATQKAAAILDVDERLGIVIRV
jgi:hypothetical protein